MALNERKEAAQLECSAFIRGLPNYSCSRSSLPTGNTWAWCAVRLRPLLKRSWMENSSQHKAALQKKDVNISTEKYWCYVNEEEWLGLESALSSLRQASDITAQTKMPGPEVQLMNAFLMLLILLEVMHNTKVYFKCPILDMKTFHLLEMFNFIYFCLFKQHE